MEDLNVRICRALLPKRAPEGHKGTFGRVCVIGGSTGYTGAPVFAAEAATRTGSGLVMLGTSLEAYPVVAGRCDSAMAFPLPNRYQDIVEKLSRCNAALLGPGLGEDLRLRHTVRSLLDDLAMPIVLDADGLNAASAHIDSLKRRTFPTVLTPHEGEFQRLGGDLSEGREAGAARLAAELGCVVVLKGPGTIIAHPEGWLRRNTTGSNALAKGGSGDILGGMILSLIGQGADPFDAASLAVYLHGRCGDMAEEVLTAYGITPTDILRAIPAAIRELLS